MQQLAGGGGTPTFIPRMTSRQTGTLLTDQVSGTPMTGIDVKSRGDPPSKPPESARREVPPEGYCPGVHPSGHYNPGLSYSSLSHQKSCLPMGLCPDVGGEGCVGGDGCVQERALLNAENERRALLRLPLVLSVPPLLTQAPNMVLHEGFSEWGCVDICRVVENGQSTVC